MMADDLLARGKAALEHGKREVACGLFGRAAELEPFPPDWRLEVEGPGSRWYPGCRVHRQDKCGSWNTALAQLDDDRAAGQ